MLRYLYADDLNTNPLLRDTMFRDRADQFKTRLGWEVSVNDQGEERDDYDDLNPLYVIWQNPDGTHGGSMRFLPTTGRCMVNEHFLALTGGVKIDSPLIWECTRFCLSRGAAPTVAAALMLAGGELLQRFDLRHFVGVFDARMVRIYRRIGASPVVLGSAGTGRDAISVGLWEFTPEAKARVMRQSGLSAKQSQAWFQQSFGPGFAPQFAMTA
jgi:acyl homoserine lactone synthase